MRLPTIQNKDSFRRHLAIWRKQATQVFRRKCNSTPVFVLGKQRSGTSMLMHVLHRHPDTLVFDEHRNSKVFDNYRLRDFDTIRAVLADARFPVVCFKPICDSHRICDMNSAFPLSHIIWLYRHFSDVANSSLRRFEDPTRAIKLVCSDQPGGGWFQEGISRTVGDVLKQIYRPTLSEFDFACLVWWARNQIILESGLMNQPDVTVLKYEALVTSPKQVIDWLCGRIGLDLHKRVSQIVKATSIGRHPALPIDPDVHSLCEATLAKLDEAYHGKNPQYSPAEQHY